MSKKKLDDQQRKFLTDNINLVFDYYRKALEKENIPPCWEEELLSHLMNKFCYSGLSYQADSGFKFSTYAFGGFDFGKEEIKAKIKQNKVFISKRSVKTIIDEESSQWDSISKGQHKYFKVEELWKIIEEAGLEETELEMIKLYFFEKCSYSYLGEYFSCSRSTIKKILSRALEKLKYFVKKEEYKVEDFFEEK